MKPKSDTPEDLQAWMLSYLTTQGKIPNVEQKAKILPGFPRIATFSGDPGSKGDTSFDLWKYEVQCLLKDKLHSREAVAQAVRKSLRGEAGRIGMRMGTDATVEKLIDKLEGVFGVVEFGETILAQFYSSKQKDGEDVTSWSCRIEDLLDKARVQGQVKETDMEEMLRTRLWNGLNDNLKTRTGHMFETTKCYDTLRVSLRIRV